MGDEGQLLGELKEFKRATLKELAELKTEVKNLSIWRTRMHAHLTGLTILLSAVFSLISTVIVKAAF